MNSWDVTAMVKNRLKIHFAIFLDHFFSHPVNPSSDD